MDTKKLRQKILDLAIHGKLVPQDPNDEPASVLLERIRVEKERLVKEGKIKKSKAAKTSDTPHYENVPFEVPDGWEWCKLGDIVSFLGGFAYKSNTYVSSSDWQVVRIGNVKNDKLLLDNQPIFVSEEIGKDTQKYLIRTDDILFSMTGTKGKRDYFFSVVVPQSNKKLLLNQRVGCLREFSKDINIHYLCLVLKGEYVLDAIFSTETGNVSQGNIGSESTLKLNIALPPLPEQIRIVKEVEKLFALVDQIEQEKVDLQTIIKQAKSKILDLAIHGKLVPQDPNDEPASELLKRINPKAEIACDNGQYGKLPKGWVTASISDCCIDILNGYAFQSCKYMNEGVRIIRITNVQDGYIEDDSPKYYPLSFILEYERFMLKSNDLLMSLTGNVGRVGFLPESMLPAALNQRVACIRSNIISTKFLSYLFRTNTFKNDCVASAKGVAQLNISTEWLKEYIIMVPPLAEQHRIVAKIEELFSSLDNIQKSLEV